jgi:hypothetical protein
VLDSLFSDPAVTLNGHRSPVPGLGPRAYVSFLRL